MKIRQTYSSLLRLYPRDYRVVFADEMLVVFDETAQQRMHQGWAFSVRFALRELAGLTIGAAREWLAKCAYSVRHSNSYIDGRGLPDRLFMRPAGVGWEAFYGGRTFRGKGIGSAGETGKSLMTHSGGEQAGSLRSLGACLNAQQRFESGSSLRRLLLFVFGDSCQCTVRSQMEHGLDGSYGSKRIGN